MGGLTAPLLCLAMTIYGEARGESILGQLAVAQVVVNRTKHIAYPSDICAVAFQPKQFAPAEKITDITEPRAFLLALRIADEILQDPPADPTKGATHFFSGSQTPYWTHTMLVTGRIGDHIFLKER